MESYSHNNQRVSLTAMFLLLLCIVNITVTARPLLEPHDHRSSISLTGSHDRQKRALDAAARKTDHSTPLVRRAGNDDSTDPEEIPDLEKTVEQYRQKLQAFGESLDRMREDLAATHRTERYRDTFGKYNQRAERQRNEAAHYRLLVDKVDEDMSSLGQTLREMAVRTTRTIPELETVRGLTESEEKEVVSAMQASRSSVEKLKNASGITLSDLDLIIAAETRLTEAKNLRDDWAKVNKKNGVERSAHRVSSADAAQRQVEDPRQDSRVPPNTSHDIVR